MGVIKKIENANDFFEAAQRCSWNHVNKDSNNTQMLRGCEHLFIPEMVNLSFACELYLKAVAEMTEINFNKIHYLDELYEVLNIEDKNAIFDLWREHAGENIIDCSYTRQTFSDNLEGIACIFTRFRYADEWAHNVISLQTSFTSKQLEKLSLFSTQRPSGSPSIYSGFLTQFAITLKKYTEQLLGKA